MAAPTSFTKRLKAKVRQIQGTKLSLYNNQLLISTGIPSLDAVLGGGVAVGTVLLLEEDFRARYSQLLVKYFCAEGVVCGHAVSVISIDQDPHQIVQNLPAPIEDGSKEKVESRSPSQPGAGDDRMAIAWRYQNQPKVQTSVSSQFGHYYNLTKRMDEDKIKSADIKCVGFRDIMLNENEHSEHGIPVPSCQYHCVMKELRRRISGKYETGTKRDDQNILRIAIQSLGSPLWGETGESTDATLLQFLLALRASLRTSYSVCLVTIPTQDFQDQAFIKRLEHLSDAVVRLESFGSCVKKKNPVLREYTGLFHLIKLPCINELVPHMPETLDLAFRVRRKKFTIEKLHLPPESSDTSSREQDDPVPFLRPQPGCSGSGTSSASKLDF